MPERQLTHKEEDAVTDLLGDPNAELHPDLKECFFEDDTFGGCIKHPLLFSIGHHDAMNDMMNRAYEQKRKMLDEAIAEEKWYAICSFIYERAWRMWAFNQYKDRMDDATYWEVLGGIWTDSENIWENEEDWAECLSSERPHRESMMDEKEREALSSLPESIEVFRGFKTGWRLEEREFGMSWTLSRERAEWFARRLAREDESPAVATARVSKSNVLAHFLGRGEEEIVVLPEHLMDVEVETLR